MVYVLGTTKLERPLKQVQGEEKIDPYLEFGLSQIHFVANDPYPQGSKDLLFDGSSLDLGNEEWWNALMRDEGQDFVSLEKNSE